MRPHPAQWEQASRCRAAASQPTGPRPGSALRAADEAPGAIAEFPAIPALDITQYRATAVSLASLHVAYRWSQEPVAGGSWIGREVEMAAHDGSEHAERAEQRDIGDSTLEQQYGGPKS